MGTELSGTPMVDYYELLQVSRRASREVIDMAFRGMMRNIRAGDEFSPENLKLSQRLAIGHRLLMNTAEREQYDGQLNLIEGKLVGQYQLISRITDGTIGRTYRARHALNGVRACIKHCYKADPRAQQNLIDESRHVMHLRHFCLPAFHDLLRLDDGSVALAMSFVPGVTVEEIVAQQGRIRPSQVAWIVDRILNAMLYLALDRELVHGDIKPANVIIHPLDHVVTLVDFGFGVSQPGPGKVSVGYNQHFSSPEQRAGEPVSFASDLYSLGLLMAYMLGGGMDAVARVSVPPRTPKPIKAFIKRLVQPSPLDRPHWQYDDNPWEVWKQIRIAVFGEEHTGLNPLPGFEGWVDDWKEEWD